MRLSPEERFREIQRIVKSSDTIFGDARLTEISNDYGSQDLYKIWWLAVARPEHDFEEPEIVGPVARAKSLLAWALDRFWGMR